MPSKSKKLLQERIDELSAKLFILQQKILSLKKEEEAIVREMTSLDDALLGVVNSGGVDSLGLAEPTTPGSNRVNRVGTLRPHGGTNVAPGSIKETALQVLAEHPEGLLALDILRLINETRNEPIVRTSLSPQLSRLGQAGFIQLDGTLWKITPAGTAILRR